MTTGQIVLLVVCIAELGVFVHWTNVALKDVKRKRKFEDEAADRVAQGWCRQSLRINQVREEHVFPVGEMHWPLECHCGERRERYEDGWVVIHSSIDGREAVDWAKKILGEK